MEEVEETNGTADQKRNETNSNDRRMRRSVGAFLLRCNIQRACIEQRFVHIKQCFMPSHNAGLTAGERVSRKTTMECTINWLPANGMAFSAQTGSGHILVMDGSPDGGGHNLAPRPMETVLAGTGGCTAYDVVLILRRGRHDVRGCQVKMRADRADTDPKVFTSIHMHFVVTGSGLSDAVVERAVHLSHEKYCSASAMLGKTARMTTSFEIIAA